MKKLLNLCMAFLLAMGVAGCSDNTDELIQASNAAVSNYIECIQDGDLEGMLDYVSSEDVDPLDLSDLNSYIEELLVDIDLGETFNNEAYDFVDSAVKGAITSYTITDTELNDGVATVTVEMTARDYSSIDFTAIETELEEYVNSYIIENEDRLFQIYQEQGEEAMTEVMVSELASYMFGEMKTLFDQAEELSGTIQFTVEEIDGEWLITDTQEV